jgi:hypothetical protein
MCELALLCVLAPRKLRKRKFACVCIAIFRNDENAALDRSNVP